MLNFNDSKKCKRDASNFPRSMSKFSSPQLFVEKNYIFYNSESAWKLLCILVDQQNMTSKLCYFGPYVYLEVISCLVVLQSGQFLTEIFQVDNLVTVTMTAVKKPINISSFSQNWFALFSSSIWKLSNNCRVLYCRSLREVPQLSDCSFHLHTFSKKLQWKNCLSSWMALRSRISRWIISPLCSISNSKGSCVQREDKVSISRSELKFLTNTSKEKNAWQMVLGRDMWASDSRYKWLQLLWKTILKNPRTRRSLKSIAFVRKVYTIMVFLKYLAAFPKIR